MERGRVPVKPTGSLHVLRLAAPANSTRERASALWVNTDEVPW